MIDLTLADQLAAIAAEMNSMDTKDESADLLYDGFAGALYWDDEVPDMSKRRIKDYWCLRPVLRYRTTLILGAPEEECREYWDEARKLFPDWIGFEASRSEPNDRLMKFYEDCTAETTAKIRRFTRF